MSIVVLSRQRITLIVSSTILGEFHNLAGCGRGGGTRSEPFVTKRSAGSRMSGNHKTAQTTKGSSLWQVTRGVDPLNHVSEARACYMLQALSIHGPLPQLAKLSCNKVYLFGHSIPFYILWKLCLLTFCPLQTYLVLLLSFSSNLTPLQEVNSTCMSLRQWNSMLNDFVLWELKCASERTLGHYSTPHNVKRPGNT